MFLGVVLLLTPLLGPAVITSWPAITAAVAGAALALGLSVKKTAQEELAASVETAEAANTAEVEVAQGEGLENMVTKEEIVLRKGAIEFRVKRDARGRCAVCVSGRGQTKAQLQALADEFTHKMTQCFVYNRVMTELKAKGFQVMNEERMEDDSLRIHVRRWEG
jgi:hypothetical protein